MALKEMPRVGDKVRCLTGNNYLDKGKVYEVIGHDFYGDALINYGKTDDCIYDITDEDFWRFELVEEVERSPQTTDDFDTLSLIANLVRRVADLERQLSDQRYNIETWAGEVEKLRVLSRSNSVDAIRIDERLSEIDGKVEMCIDDIVTLDERTRTEKGGCCGC